MQINGSFGVVVKSPNGDIHHDSCTSGLSYAEATVIFLTLCAKHNHNGSDVLIWRDRSKQVGD